MIFEAHNLRNIMWDMEEIQMAKKAAVKEVILETTLWNCRVALRGIGSTEKTEMQSSDWYF